MRASIVSCLSFEFFLPMVRVRRHLIVGHTELNLFDWRTDDALVKKVWCRLHSRHDRFKTVSGVSCAFEMYWHWQRHLLVKIWRERRLSISVKFDSVKIRGQCGSSDHATCQTEFDWISPASEPLVALLKRHLASCHSTRPWDQKKRNLVSRQRNNRRFSHGKLNAKPDFIDSKLTGRTVWCGRVWLHNAIDCE